MLRARPLEAEHQTNEVFRVRFKDHLPQVANNYPESHPSAHKPIEEFSRRTLTMNMKMVNPAIMTDSSFAPKDRTHEKARVHYDGASISDEVQRGRHVANDSRAPRVEEAEWTRLAPDLVTRVFSPARRGKH